MAIEAIELRALDAKNPIDNSLRALAREWSPVPPVLATVAERIVGRKVPQKMALTFRSGEKTRTLFSSVANIAREALKKGDKGLIERFMEKDSPHKQAVADLLWAMNVTVDDLACVFAPGSIGIIDLFTDRGTTRREKIEQLLSFSPNLVARQKPKVITASSAP